MSIPSVTFPVKHEDIPKHVKELTEALEGKKAEIDIIRTMLKAVRAGCKHENAKKGHNERDGYWMAACPHCGHSE